MRKLSVLLFLIFFVLIEATWGSVGTVQLIKGSAQVGETPLAKGDPLQEGDQVSTAKESLIIIRMNDRTTLTLGPESKIIIAKYSNQNEPRNNYIKHLQGNLRSLVEKATSPDEKIRFDAQLISVGVRGTEFITNAYQVGGAPSTDTLLIEGSLDVTGPGFEPFTLEEGEYFNSQEITKLRNQAIKKASDSELKVLRNNHKNIFGVNNE